MKLALVVIDMQKCFLKDHPDPSAVSEVCEYINYVAGVLRKNDHAVIHVQDIEDADEYAEGEIDFIDQIDVEPSDLKVTKEYSNAFWKTDLERIVTDAGCDLLILAGQAAEHCVVFTYNGALERGHKAALLQNGVLSSQPDRVRQLMEDRQVISHGVVEILAGV